MQPRIAVFAGPSLPATHRIARDDVCYLPPASRGDIERAATEFKTILLIDGVFDQDLAPSPGEVYAALSRVRLFGAASMGALRAAECAHYGMVPLGIIARWYVREVITGDDEVALLYDAETETSLTVPLVNVRYLARIGRRRQLLSGAESHALIETAARVFYADRTWQAILERFKARSELLRIAQTEADLKRCDAIFALRTVCCLRRRAGGRTPAPNC